MSLVLSAEHLFCERDDRVLFDALSFKVQAGDILYVTGTNGSGKTTLLRYLVGLTAVVEGQLQWHLNRPNSAGTDAGRIEYIAHQPAVTLLQTPLENLRYFLCLQARQLPHSDLLLALEKVGLRGFEETACYQLSAGQQRRVALARLFLPQNEVIAWVLDEPLTALDAAAAALLKNRISDFAKQGGAVIMTSHHGMEDASIRRLVLGVPS